MTNHLYDLVADIRPIARKMERGVADGDMHPSYFLELMGLVLAISSVPSGENSRFEPDSLREDPSVPQNP